jgi:hypothetical protein
VCSPFVGASERNHTETCAGCIVSLSTPTRSLFNASGSVSELGGEGFQGLSGLVLPPVEAPSGSSIVVPPGLVLALGLA